MALRNTGRDFKNTGRHLKISRFAGGPCIRHVEKDDYDRDDDDDYDGDDDYDYDGDDDDDDY